MTVGLVTKGFICPTTNIVNFAMNIDAELTDCELPCSDCSMPAIKIGNSLTLDFLLKSGGVRLTQATLDAADDIIFSVKEDSQDANIDSLILKSIGSGVATLPDGVDLPNVRVTLTSADTILTPGSYPTALQVNFAADDCKEADLSLDGFCFNEVVFEQDIIRC